MEWLKRGRKEERNKEQGKGHEDSHKAGARSGKRESQKHVMQLTANIDVAGQRDLLVPPVTRVAGGVASALRQTRVGIMCDVKDLLLDMTAKSINWY